MNQRARQEQTEWTEVYHSWAEFIEKNPDLGKYPSSRIAGAFALMHLNRGRVDVAYYFTSRSNNALHRNILESLKRLRIVEERSRDCRLQFD